MQILGLCIWWWKRLNFASRKLGVKILDWAAEMLDWAMEILT